MTYISLRANLGIPDVIIRSLTSMYGPLHISSKWEFRTQFSKLRRFDDFEHPLVKKHITIIRIMV